MSKEGRVTLSRGCPDLHTLRGDGEQRPAAGAHRDSPQDTFDMPGPIRNPPRAVFTANRKYVQNRLQMSSICTGVLPLAQTEDHTRFKSTFLSKVLLRYALSIWRCDRGAQVRRLSSSRRQAGQAYR